MKRTLTIMLTVAMIGSLMFMGLAGTAAADEHDGDGINVELGGDGGDATNHATVNQQNNNQQVGSSSAYAKGDGSWAYSSVNQAQYVGQSNYANVNQHAEAGDGGTGIDLDLNFGFVA